VVRGQRKVDTKATELTAIPQLLEWLARQGGSVTIAARGGQRASAQRLSASGADYVRTGNGNPPTLPQDVQACVALGPEAEERRPTGDSSEDQERGHGREAPRRSWSTDAVEDVRPAPEGPGWQSIGMGEATRTLAEKPSVAQRFYSTRLAADAQTLARAVRNHGGIETGLHWTLEVTLREEQRRLRQGHGPENLAVLRHLALHLLRQEPSQKSMPRKRLACALDPEYLLKVLLGQRF
jgi:predicted transposase YbfD/YdcC